jgi:hypothetical protein
MNDLQLESAACPVHAAGNVRSVVSQSDDLVVPKHRQMFAQYLADEAGATELHLFYGDREISFDEPDLFPFGEALAKHPRFTAGDATGWGEGYEWPRIRDLLQQLIDQGILVHAADLARETVPAVNQNRIAPLPPGPCPVARSWDECEAITRELTSRPVELGYLELIMPVFRVAHIAVDADQRQVGEANVFPEALRLDVPTEWRTCNLPGTRFQNERPMNVTAMRVMRAHWPQMMAAVLRTRDGYLRRFPEAEGAWTIGHVLRLSVAVLAVPTYQLMRRHGRVENGSLHPALSSLFRVTDGVRMTMYHMLIIPVGEPLRSPLQAVTVDDTLAYAERSYSFFSVHGVCAGPRAMVRELLQVLLEGRGDADYASLALDPAVQAAFNDLDAAIDYGLHGLRAHAAAYSIWPAMARAYTRIAEIVETWPSNNTTGFSAFRETMRKRGGELRNSALLANEDMRRSRDNLYADMYDQCGRGARNSASTVGLHDQLAPVWTNRHRQMEAKLQEILRSHAELDGITADAFVLDLADCIMDFLLRVQAMLRTAVAAQNDVNRLLGREQPNRAFSAADLNVYNLMQGDNADRHPYLIDELEHLLGITIQLDADSLTIDRRDATA